ncbi:esterase family protein [Rhizobium sp. SSA_523]|uniref:esterase family protein n=1 Tax=Rhizobium sp. SSA_523 TaxID=2952477 RepID=UPI0020908031|nr:alpha/beta hydrolase-fold protein [Rhizobium sp. SSA_523]MCO5730463.1 alpha/beta hydrolase-fold protein [Rhizobium sp. SSA_523]WKC25504.1 alpha/beta hydrolase-fold protein [Rhizobium sp. SSA_523]
MKREYLRWFSPRLHREMELLIFGEAGAKVLVFPTRDGRFFEYEQLGLVASLEEKIRSRHLQLFCIEGLARESFYCDWRRPFERLSRHAVFEDYVLNEVLPLMQARNGHDCTIAHGCSLGAFQAASIALRHPHLFCKLAAFSGRYDLTLPVEHFGDLLDGHYDEDVYFRMPTHFLPNLGPSAQLEALRRLDIVLVIGADDPFLDNNRHLSHLLSQKAIPHRLHVWDGRAHQGAAWRRMAPLYI